MISRQGEALDLLTLLRKKEPMVREALPVFVVAFPLCVCVSALAIKFPGADGYLAHARAPDS